MNSTDQSQAEVENVLGLDQEARTRVRFKRWLFPIAGALVILVVVVIAMNHKGEPTVHYQTQKAQRGDLIVTVSATGNLEPTNNVNVGSELSGIVKSVEVEENEWVKAGQVLARLDTEKLTAAVRKSRAALESAQANVLDAQATIREKSQAFERFKKAYAISGGKIPSQDDLDTAEAALVRARADEASAKAAVTEAQATLDSNLTDLKKAVIVSPINGIVLTRDVEPGQTVAASLQAVTLFNLAQDLTRMELNVSVDEADVGRIKPGQSATFSVDAYPDRNFQAEITRVSYGSTTTDGVVEP
jgi:HlyD family secretion protein